MATVLQATSASEREEAALSAAARSRDQAAVDALVRRYLGDVYELAARILGDRDLAQDAAQDAFLNALRGLHRFRGDASFRTWLLRIAANAARSLARRRGRRREVAITFAENAAATTPDPASAAASTTDAERAARLLDRLPDELLLQAEELRRREHELWRSDQDHIARAFTPRQRAVFTLRWIRFQERIQELIQARRSGGRPPGR